MLPTSTNSPSSNSAPAISFSESRGECIDHSRLNYRDFEDLIISGRPLDEGLSLDALDLPSQNSLLSLALHVNNIQATQFILSKNTDYSFINGNAGHDEWVSVLLQAITISPEMVKAVIDMGADINKFDCNGNATALLYAIDNQRADIVQLLLETGANLKGVDSSQSPLFRAVRSGNIDIVRTLINAHVDVNAVYECEWTDLMWAVEGGSAEMVELLVKHGANVNACNRRGETALHIAIDNENLSVAAVLLDAELLDTRYRDQSGTNGLMKAVVSEEDEMVALMIKKGFDLDAPDNNGMTALMYASSSGNMVIVRQLLDAGANANCRDISDRGNMLLARVSTIRKPELMRAIIAAGADIHARNYDGYTAMMLAAQRGSAAEIEALRELGANVNDRFKGLSTLMLAVQSRNCDAVRYLLRHDADVHVKHVAPGGNEMTALMYASLDPLGQRDLIDELVEWGADVNAKNIKGDTPLMLAIRAGNGVIQSALIESGAHVNAKNHTGNSPLMLACSAGDLLMVKSLVNHGADLFATNDVGHDALFVTQSSTVESFLRDAIRLRLGVRARA